MSTTLVAQAKPLTAIEVIEQDLVGFKQQLDQAVMHVHMIQGAIQGGTAMLNRLKAEEAKAVAFVKAEAEAAATAVTDAAKTVGHDISEEVSNIVEFAKKEL